MYGIDVNQFRDVVESALRHIALHSLAAENLVLGTAMVESELNYIKQIDGPALGFFQMEPTTHDDIWENFLPSQKELTLRVQMLLPRSYDRASNELIHNIRYAAAMCRIHYLRVPQPLPSATDAQGMASYWKRYYNTMKGKGTVEKALRHFQVATQL